MPAQRHQKHTIDFLFPAALFLVFAVSALCVMLLAAGIYRQSAVETAKNDVSRTALSYISEKIHQGDSGDAVHLGTFDGTGMPWPSSKRWGTTAIPRIFICMKRN